MVHCGVLLGKTGSTEHESLMGSYDPGGGFVRTQRVAVHEGKMSELNKKKYV